MTTRDDETMRIRNDPEARAAVVKLLEQPIDAQDTVTDDELHWLIHGGCPLIGVPIGFHTAGKQVSTPAAET